MSWYAIQCLGVPRGLDLVRLAAIDAGLFARIPRCTITQRPIFAEYVFLDVPDEYSLPECMDLIRAVPAAASKIAHVAGLVTEAEMLAIDAVERFAASEAVPIALHGVRHGDIIEITSGPMAGQRATFVRGEHKHGRYMLVVDVAILGRVVAWELEPSAAKRVAAIVRDRKRAKRKPTRRH
jgi:transcription antitermination factor NusG